MWYEWRLIRAWATTGAVGLAGCTSMPTQVVHYSLPEAVTTVTVTQTLACTTNGKDIVTALDVDAATQYPASATAGGSIVLGQFSGGAKTTSLSIELKDDGRLSGINASSQGQGLAIAKGVIAVLAPAFGALATEMRDVDATGPCTGLNNVAKPGKNGEPPMVTVTSALTVGYTGDGLALAKPPGPGAGTSLGASQSVRPDATSDGLADAVGPAVGQLTLRLEPPAAKALKSLPISNGLAETSCLASDADSAIVAADGFYPLRLRKVDRVTLVMSFTDSHNKSKDVWRANVDVPVDRCYALLVPVGSAGGSSQFELTLADSGRITHLKYGGTPAGADALSAVGALLAAKPDDAAQAKALQAKADRIAQQQRLVACRVSPSTCK